MLRNDTVPDDIKEVNEADGLLTARGGSTSHAAIVAHRLGKTCVTRGMCRPRLHGEGKGLLIGWENPENRRLDKH